MNANVSRPEKLKFPGHHWMVVLVDDGSGTCRLGPAHLFPAFFYTALCGYDAEKVTDGYTFVRVQKELDDDFCSECISLRDHD